MTLTIYFNGTQTLTISDCTKNYFNAIIECMQNKSDSKTITMSNNDTKQTTVINTDNITYMYLSE